MNSNEQELEKSKDKRQWEQMANQVGSYFPKGGHSATTTELKA